MTAPDNKNLDWLDKILNSYSSKQAMFNAKSWLPSQKRQAEREWAAIQAEAKHQIAARLTAAGECMTHTTPQGSTPTSAEELRKRIILLLGNALYSGKSIAQISKITNKQLAPFEVATDQIMQLFNRYATSLARAELEKLEALPNVYPEKINGEYTHVEAIYKSAISEAIAALQGGNTDV